MNICIESKLLNHHRRSGLLTYTEGLVNGLSAYDRDNTYSLLYYSLSRPAQLMPGPAAPNFTKKVVRVPDRDFFARQWVLDQVALPAFLKNNNIRIFHRPSGYTMPRVKGVYTVLTVHDLRTLTIGDEFWSQNIGNYQKTIAAVDMCVVVSECTKIDMIERLKVPENKIRVIYLGADKRFRKLDAPAVEQVRAKYGLSEPFLLSIGSVPRKNIDGIIRAFALSKVHKNVDLVLSCNYHVDEYRQLARELGVEARIKILSTLSDEDVVALYNGCQAFVFPSLYEGFGLPILEAMQCGAPVITSNMSSCPEVAGDAAILVDPKNTGAIAEAMNVITTDDALRRDLIAKGDVQARKFDWNIYAREMKKIYESV